MTGSTGRAERFLWSPAAAAADVPAGYAAAAEQNIQHSPHLKLILNFKKILFLSIKNHFLFKEKGFAFFVYFTVKADELEALQLRG